MTARRVWVLGYGSLMSWTGLGAQRDLVRDAWPARVVARRAFDKPAITGMIAMDLMAPARATLRGRRDQPGVGDEALGPGPVIGAMLLHLQADGTTPLAKREGYPEPAWRRLLELAGARGLGHLLLDVARATGDDPLAYRRALRELAGPSDLDCYHYVPHPVDLGDEEPAVAFVAPARGASGDLGCDSAKAHYPGQRPLLLHELYRAGPQVLPGLFDPERQRVYVEKCYLGHAHGIDVTDLHGGPLHDDDPTARMLESWRRAPRLLHDEQEAFRSLVRAFADRDVYAARFHRAPRVATLA